MDQLIIYFLVMFPLAILFNIPILIIIVKKKLLTIPSGVIVGSILGVVFFIVNPFFWLALLFFALSSSLLTKIKTTEKDTVILDFEKGSAQRDANQVIANGLTPAFFVLAYAILNLIPNLLEVGYIIIDPFDPFLIGVFTSFAVHNADTWATEIGILSSKTPRMIVHPKKRVAPGTSGGVTLIGIIASVFGASFLAVLYLILIVLTPPNIFNPQFIFVLFIIILAGLFGSLIDSIEGATIQGIYYCDNCHKETESNPHPRCGSKTRYHRGFTLINNDFVNFSSAFIVSSLMYIILLIIP